MAAGIPGAGIGGLFYILNALLLPVRGVVRALRGHDVEWRPLLRQAALAIGIVLGIIAAGIAIGAVIGPSPDAGATARTGIAAQTVRVVGIAAVYLSVATLAIVLVLVQVARFTTRRPR